jgi:hypothetical protein
MKTRTTIQMRRRAGTPPWGIWTARRILPRRRKVTVTMTMTMAKRRRTAMRRLIPPTMCR